MNLIEQLEQAKRTIRTCAGECQSVRTVEDTMSLLVFVQRKIDTAAALLDECGGPDIWMREAARPLADVQRVLKEKLK